VLLPSERLDQEAFRKGLAEQREKKLDLQKANKDFLGDWEKKGMQVRLLSSHLLHSTTTTTTTVFSRCCRSVVCTRLRSSICCNVTDNTGLEGQPAREGRARAEGPDV
jgi:hypothetical protein